MSPEAPTGNCHLVGYTYTHTHIDYLTTEGPRDQRKEQWGNAWGGEVSGGFLEEVWG